MLNNRHSFCQPFVFGIRTQINNNVRSRKSYNASELRFFRLFLFVFCSSGKIHLMNLHSITWINWMKTPKKMCVVAATVATITTTAQKDMHSGGCFFFLSYLFVYTLCPHSTLAFFFIPNTIIAINILVPILYVHTFTSACVCVLFAFCYNNFSRCVCMFFFHVYCRLSFCDEQNDFEVLQCSCVHIEHTLLLFFCSFCSIRQANICFFGFFFSRRIIFHNVYILVHEKKEDCHRCCVFNHHTLSRFHCPQILHMFFCQPTSQEKNQPTNKNKSLNGFTDTDIRRQNRYINRRYLSIALEKLCRSIGPENFP